MEQRPKKLLEQVSDVIRLFRQCLNSNCKINLFFVWPIFYLQDIFCDRSTRHF